MASPCARTGARIRYGPAGWSYPDWAGTVYPKPAPRAFDPLAYLCRYFATVELNTTFYRPAEPRIAETWLRRVEGRADFRFTAKLHRRFTHERQTAWTRGELEETRAGLEVLQRGGRLGAVLLQFPWSFRCTGPEREWLGDLLDALEGLPCVLEVRHESWNRPELFEELSARGVGFVNVDQPLFRRSLRPSAHLTSPVGYIRVHGRNYREWFRRDAGRDARYDYLYPARELEPWVERVRTLAREAEAEELYVVTNNHARGQAAANALMLQAMVEERRVACPPALEETYREVLRPFVQAEAEGAPTVPG